MHFEFIFIGKSDTLLEETINYYSKKINRYVPLKITIITPSKEKVIERILTDESQRILRNISTRDFLFVLDENGREFSSPQLASEFQRIMNKSTSKVVFITGSAYGIDNNLKKRANIILSFSKFTFTHQMIRLLLAEQVYRAMTILKGEKYHHH